MEHFATVCHKHKKKLIEISITKPINFTALDRMRASDYLPTAPWKRISIATQLVKKIYILHFTLPQG